MDIRRMLIAMLLAMGLIVVWPLAYDWVLIKLGYDPRPKTPQTTTQPAEEPATQPVAQAPQAPSAPTPAPVAPAAARTAPATNAVVARLGSDSLNDPNYRLAATISPRGAGLESVTLNQFKVSVAKDASIYVFQKPFQDRDAFRPLGMRALSIDGVEVDLSVVDWNLESQNQQTATYTTTVLANSLPAVRIRRAFQILPSSDPSQGYEMEVGQTIENLTDRELKIRTMFNGVSPPLREQDRGHERSVLAGYGTKGMILVNHDMTDSFGASQLTKEYIKDKNGNPIMWAGFAGSYFNTIIRPVTDDQNSPPGYLQNVTAISLDPTAKPEDHQMLITFLTNELNVPAGRSLSMPLRVFFGPRKRDVLNGAFYSQFPMMYGQSLVLTSGPCSVCTFQWLIDLLVKLLAAFHYLFGGFAGRGDWGLAIIALVVLVRALLHPITKKSQISMAKMGKMGPEMERLRKKYGDNKEELSKAMWELQKEQGLGPYLGCLPMFLQMPIWIALWQSLNTTFELRQAPFLWGHTWIDDLSRPDNLIPLGHTINVWFLPLISGLNILPILMGAVFYLQMKFQPKPPTMTKEQEQQQKMMMWMMPVLFPLMLYSGPSGLNLYILTSTLIGIIESKVVRDHIKQQEEAEKAGRVIVDPGKKHKGGGSPKLIGSEKEKPKTGLMGWLQRLQEQAEQMRRDADKRKK